MEVVSLVREALQSGAERAASYRAGQIALRQADRALWALEKSARWVVPPPLEADERAQPELVRPLPWPLFLALLVTLRITRESISLLNLVMGKPPLRSADVVTYIQSKRRYLRTLKYQGNRLMRARSAGRPGGAWGARLQAAIELAFCFRRPAANNNSAATTNNEEVLVVKRSKRGRAAAAAAAAAAAESTMERLIERMMVDLDADSGDDSSYTLTNPASIKSDSDLTESEHEAAAAGAGAGAGETRGAGGETRGAGGACSTPNKDDSGKNTTAEISPEKTDSMQDEIDLPESPEKATRIPISPANNQKNTEDSNSLSQKESAGPPTKGELENNGHHSDHDRIATEALLESERQKKTPKKSQKIANGRTIDSSHTKKRATSKQSQQNN